MGREGGSGTHFIMQFLCAGNWLCSMVNKTMMKRCLRAPQCSHI